MNISIVTLDQAKTALPQLSNLLMDAVNHGASIGFMPPLSPADAEMYWQGRFQAITDGACVLALAWESDIIVGSAQLGLELRANGNHRAEVQKVMVHTNYRRQGIGGQLMQVLEDYACNNGRSLLVLDTRRGDPSETLYRKLGYSEAGKIPNYARSANGELHGTVFYYKILG